MQLSDNTPRHNKVRQVTSSTEAPLHNRYREQSVRPSPATSRRLDTVQPKGATQTQVSNATPKSQPKNLARPSALATKQETLSRTVDDAISPNNSRVVKRKKIRVTKAGSRSTSQPEIQPTATIKSDRDNKVTKKPTTVTPRIQNSSTNRAKPSTSFRSSTPTMTTSTESRKDRSSSISPPTTTTATIEATSAVSKLIGFPTASTIRRLTTAQPNVKENTSEVSQPTSQARRPTTRISDKKPINVPTTTKPQTTQSISRGSQRSTVSVKKSPTRAQLEEFDEENYPEHYKIALKAKLSIDPSNTVSQKPLQKPRVDQPTTTTKPNSVRIFLPKLEKVTTPDRFNGDSSPNTFDRPDQNSINPATYIDYQNSSPKYSSRIRHNENRVQEPAHKVRARSQNLSNPTNGNQLLETNGLATSSLTASKEVAASVVSISIVFYIVRLY